MCTIIIINHHHKDFPLIVAANRDEDYYRKSSPVQILSREPHLIMGGKDEVKGGTWLGVNKESLFVTGTNQGKSNPKLASRGLLIAEALKCKSLDELLLFVEELDPSKYNSFNIVFGNNKTVYMAHSYLLHSMVVREVKQGINVITNDMKFAGQIPTKVKYIHDRLDDIIDTPWPKYYKLIKKVLASGENGVKIGQRKNDAGKYGYCTRSSSILAFSNEGLARYKFYDRTSYATEKKEKKEGDPFIPRYKDYIDTWRGQPVSISAVSEEGENEAEDNDVNLKERLIDKFAAMKND